MHVQSGSPSVSAEERDQRALLKALGGTVDHFLGKMVDDFPWGLRPA
jgi:hypothetical protein